MAKSGQYTKARRVVMQAVMAVVLGATVALAALVTRRTPDEQLTGPHLFNNYNLRVWLPEGWRVQGPRLEPPGEIVILAKEPGPPDVSRTIRVVLIPSQDVPADVYLQDKVQSRHRRFPRLDFLGQKGFMAEVRYLRPPRGDEIEPQPSAATLAHTVLPSKLGVLVEIHGASAFGPATRRLVERVAKRLELVDPAALPAAPNAIPAPDAEMGASVLPSPLLGPPGPA